MSRSEFIKNSTVFELERFCKQNGYELIITNSASGQSYDLQKVK